MNAFLGWRIRCGHGDVVEFDAWLNKPHSLQILEVLPTSTVTSKGPGPSTIFPHLFAVVKFLSENGSGNVEEAFESIITTYLKAGCDLDSFYDFPPSTRSRKGFTPLLLAIEQRKTLFARVLIRLGANVNICDEAGFSPLHWVAFSTSSTLLMKCLLDAGATVVVEEERDGSQNTEEPRPRPLLLVAVDEGRVEIVDFLLRLGFDVNTSAVYSVLQERHWDKLESRYNCGKLDLSCYLENIKITALGRAVRMRKLDVLSILLRHPKVSVSLSDLHFCILEGDTETGNMIIGKVDPALLAEDRIMGTSIYSLHLLGKIAFDPELAEETLKLVKTYISHGFDINSVSQVEDRDGGGGAVQSKSTNLLLRLTSSTVNLKMFQSLVHLGADPFLPIGNEEGSSSSIYSSAVASSDMETVQICLQSPGLTLEKRLEFFDDVLSITLTNSDMKFRCVKFIKENFRPHVQLKASHLLKAIKTRNELLVFFILQNLSKDESEFRSIFNPANDADITFPKRMHDPICQGPESHMPSRPGYLEDFLYAILKKDELFVGIEMSVDIYTVLTIIRGFLDRGYQLPQRGCNSLAALVVYASLNNNFANRLVNSPAVFNELILHPGINWSPGLCSREAGCPSLPLALVLTMISTCTMPAPYIDPETTFLPLWIGDNFSSQIHPILTPSYSRTLCHRVKNNLRHLAILEKLLDKGVPASGFLLTNLLQRHKCLIRFLPLIKKLWWAGAVMDFDTISTFYNDESLLYYGEGDKDFVKDFRDWVGENGGKKADSSLKRSVVVKIRQSLKYQDIPKLAEGCSSWMPSKLLTDLILRPHY